MDETKTDFQKAIKKGKQVKTKPEPKTKLKGVGLGWAG